VVESGEERRGDGRERRWEERTGYNRREEIGEDKRPFINY
jgi:hypothetical protein